ncbi:MAG: protein kinase, partial [Gemmatimonadota bacterium]|nr:protein kinase [Gemmatimonadota bacterium]
MSRVFVAREHALNRTVVVKVLGPEVAADVNRERFRREIMLAAQLQHPLIVPVLSAGEQGELLWYTMPFVEGESLREEIRRGQPASVRSAIRVLHDVLDALAYAHARGVIHRDIKPGNVLRHGTHSLVTDFGVAKALSAALPTSGTTSAGLAIGTPAYMAPEQLAADPSANHRMDIYAAGLLVYELLTGTQAFAESSPQATLAAQLTRMPRHLAEVRPDVPPALASLIMKMLAKNPDDRPQSATAALDELDAVVTPTGTAAPYAAPGTGRTYMRSGLVAAVTLSIVVAGIVALALGQRGAETIPGARDTVAAASATLPVQTTTPASEAPGARRPAPPPTGKVADVKGAPPTSAPSEVADRAKTPATKSAATGKAEASGATKPTAGRTRRPAPALNRRVAILPIRVSSNRENVAAAVPAIDDSLKNALVAAGYTLATDSELLRLITQQNMAGGGLRKAADAAGIGAVVRVEV